MRTSRGSTSNMHPLVFRHVMGDLTDLTDPPRRGWKAGDPGDKPQRTEMRTSLAPWREILCTCKAGWSLFKM